MNYKIDFENLEWEVPYEGIRHKYFDQNNIRMRLVEYSKEMPPHWCEKGHYGIILDGILEIEYNNEILRYEKGDGVFIPNGKDFKHKAVVISDKVTVFFVENVK